MKTSSQIYMLEGVEELLKQIGQNIRTARIRRNMTIKELANRVHIDEKTVSRIENGQPTTNLKNLLTILVIFGLEESALQIANPDQDELGKALEMKHDKKRVRNQVSMNDDF